MSIFDHSMLSISTGLSSLTPSIKQQRTKEGTNNTKAEHLAKSRETGAVEAKGLKHQNLVDALISLSKWSAGESKKKDRCHWHKQRFPLDISIQSKGKPHWVSSDEFEHMVVQAFHLWQCGTPEINIQIVSESIIQPSSSDIIIEWNDTPVKGRDFEVGHANRTLSGKDLTGCHVINDPKGILKHNEKIIAFKEENSLPSFVGGSVKKANLFIDSINSLLLYFS